MRGPNRSWARTALVVALVACMVLWAPASVVGPAIGVATAQEEGGQPRTPASYYGNVTIDGDPAPTGTVIEAEVNGTVYGSITVDELGEYGGEGALEEKLTVVNESIENGSEVRFYADNENIERTEATRTVVDGNSTTVTWEPGDVTNVDLAFASGSGLYEATINDVDDSVVAGDSITLDATVENIAENADTQTVNVTLNDEVVSQRDIELDPNETSTISEIIDVGTDAGDEVTVGVETVDDRATETVAVDAPAEFAVTDFQTNNVGAAGESFDANVTIENVGDVSGTQNLSVTYAGETVFDEARELDAGETNSTNLTIDTEVGDAGEPDVIAETDDDRAIRTLNLSAPAFFSVEVIEADSDESVVEGQNATVVAEVENTGGDSDKQDINVTENGSTVATESDVTLDPGEITTIEREINTTNDGNSTLDVAVESDDDSDSLEVTVEEASAATYTVDILGINGTVPEPATDGGETIEARVQVENVGQEDGDVQDIDFAVDGDVRNTTEIELDGTRDGGNTSHTFNETIDVNPGDAPEVDVTVSSANETATRTVDVTSLPEFAITDIGVPDNVEVDDEFTPNATVENLGEQKENASVAVRFNGTTVGTTPTSDLASGDTDTIDLDTLNATEQGVDDGVRAQVAVNATNDATGEEDDVSTAGVFISNQTPPNLEVNSLDVSSDSVVAGDALTVDATVENTGEVTANQTVILDFGGNEIAARTVTLGEDETESISVQRPTQFGDIGNNTVSVSTDDDSATDFVDVLDPAAFDAEFAAIDDSVVAGENVSIDARVVNTGNETAGTDLTVFLNGRQKTRSISSLDGDNTTRESFEFRTTADDVGELDVAATTPDDLETATVQVVEPADFEVTFTSVPGEITNESTFNSTVRVENVGEAEGTETIRLESDDFSDSERVNLDGGEVERIELSDANVPPAGTNTTVQAIVVEAGGDTTETKTVDVIEAPSDPRFALSSVETRDAVIEPVDNTTITVNTTVTNVGDETGTQSIDLIVDDEQRDSTVSNLDGGNSTDISLKFTLNATDLAFTDGVDEIAIDLESENQTVSDTLLVEEADPAELQIDSVSDLEEVDAGDTLSANVTVSNVGDRDADNGTVTLEYVPTGDTTTVDATPNASDDEEVQVGVEVPDAPRAGEFDRDFRVTAAADGQAEAAERTFTERVDYGSIRSGVAQATPGDTVLIAPEPDIRPSQDEQRAYTERDTIVVDTRNVTLEAAGDERPIIAPRNDETAVRVEAADVTLRELVLEGDGNETAVVADDSTVVESTEITGWDLGVASNAGSATVRSALIENVDTGVDFASNEPSELAFSTVRADRTGVRITGDQTTLSDSSTTGAEIGVDLVGTGDVSIDRMRIQQNSEYGLRASNAAPNANPVPGNETAVSVDSTNFESNAVGVLAENSVVDASGNWWGSADTPEFGDNYVAFSDVVVANNSEARFAPDIRVDIEENELGQPAVQGEGLTVPVDVTNDGGLGADQTIVLTADGGREDSATVSVEAGAASADGSLELSLGNLQRFTSDGDVTLGVQSENDSDTLNVNVVEPAAFEIDSVNAPSVPLGNDLAVEVTVNNTGGVSENATVTLNDGTGTATNVVSVPADGTATTTFTRDTTAFGNGSQALTVSVSLDGTPQDSVSRSPTVDPAALSTIGLDVADTELDVGDTTTASVTETLTDGSTNGVTGSADITSNDSDVVSVDGSNLTAEGTGTATITAQYTADGSTETASVSVTVSEAGDGGDGGDGGGGFVDDQQPASLELDATTTETVTPSLDLGADQRVATTDSVDNVDEIVFDTTDQIGDVTVADVDPETADVDPPGGTVTLQEIVVPDDATDQSATISFRVSAERLDAVGAPVEDLSAIRLTDDGWETLETSVAEETDERVTLEAQTPGFSVFAVNAVGQPDAIAAVGPETATAGESVTLDGSESSTPYGEIVSYEWSVAGQTLSGETASATLDEAGEYTVELTVTNDAGETDTTTETVTVDDADGTGDADDADGTGDADDADGTGDADDADGEPAGFGVTAVLALLVLALVAAAAVFWIRQDE
jgi:PGF-pre-PGF domain-containing protein